MIETETLILGGGLSALIAKSYFDDDKCICVGSSLGGRGIASGMPMFLHADPDVERFLKRHNFSTKTDVANIGFFYNGTFHGECPDVLRAEYVKKSRAGSVNVSSSMMSCNASAFHYFKDVAPAKIIGEFGDGVILDSAMSIDTKTRVAQFKNTEEIKYEYLISCIPAPTLFSVLHLSEAWSAFKYQSTFVDVMSRNFVHPFEGRFDYVYFPEAASTKYYRVTSMGRGLYGCEYPGNEGLGIGQMLNEVDVKKILEENSMGDICLLGRTAEWDHTVKLNTVIGRLEKGLFV